MRLVQQAEAPQVRAGFGENTLSPLGAALKTLDGNLAAVESVVPTVEELRERSRVIQAERLDNAPTSRPVERPEEFRRRESVRPEPDPAVQNFVQDTGAVEFLSRPEAPEITSDTEPDAAAEATQPTDVPALGLAPPVPAPASRVDIFA